MTENKKNIERTIEFTLSGDAIHDGRVSVKLFTAMLSSIQSVVNNLAKSRLEIDPSIPGRMPSDIAVHTELYLVKTKEGSLTAELAFPEKTEDMFPEFPDFEDKLINDTQNVIDALSRRDKRKLVKVVPNPKYRQRIIRDLLRISPGTREDYSFNIRVGSGKNISLVKPDREEIPVLLEIPSSDKTPDVYQAMVHAIGLAEIEEGDIKRWIETYDLQEEEIDLERSWRPKSISWSGHEYLFAHPIVCAVSQEKDEFIIEYEPLNIVAFGETREIAQESFSREFHVLSKEIAEEDDNNLTKDAQVLKEKMTGIIKSVNIK